MSTTKAIRLSVNEDVNNALEIARKKYPALSDAELLKVGLSLIVTKNTTDNNGESVQELHKMAAYAVGHDYLADCAEDLYDNV